MNRTAMIAAVAILVLGGRGADAQGADAAKTPKKAKDEQIALSPTLERFGNMAFPALAECSGIVRSRRHDNVFWTHNDSGDEARIFAIRRDGTIILPEGAEAATFPGVVIRDAVNRDWEDIAIDDAGNLYVGDIGNNNNERRNLGVYVVPEPDPVRDAVATASGIIRYRYPDQEAFPPAAKNFDSEALFWARGSLFVLTKHRADTRTKLYRLPASPTEGEVEAVLLGDYNVGMMVTAADASSDGRRIAVLTYGSAWLFEAPEEGDNYLARPLGARPLAALQCEAICFDGPDLLITNEQRGVYRLSQAEVTAAGVPSAGAAPK